MCERYPDDFAAGLALFEVVKWVTCLEGRWHVVAHGRPKRRQNGKVAPGLPGEGSATYSGTP
jgi:hypothetical protein